MKINSLSLPHPVLGSGDDVDGHYLADCDVSLNPNEVTLTIKHDLQNKTLENFINNDKAIYSVEIHCMPTVYRTTFFSKHKDQVITIPAELLRNKVEVEFYITAKTDLPDYEIDGSNSDYKGYKFDVGKSDILAYGGKTHFPALKDWEALQAISSFMEIQESPDSESPMYFELKGEKIIVRISKEDKKKYDLYKGVKKLEPIFHSEIVFPALIHTLYQMHKTPDDFDELGWYYVLNYKLDNDEQIKKLDRANEDNYPKIAQILLDNPLARSFDQGIIPLIQGERDQEE